jgi:hypothetical protein
VVDRSRDGLEPLIYSSIEKMREDYQNDVVRGPLLLRNDLNLTVLVDSSVIKELGYRVSQ